MNVLDPFEVAEIEVWPLYTEDVKGDIGKYSEFYPYTVFQKVLKASKLGAVLNEKDIPKTRLIKLPQCYRGRIIPEGLYETAEHPDTRIARRASTIANLARVISERNVSKGLRRTLLTQARRLERLAAERLAEFTGDYPVEEEGEETGEEVAE